MLKGLIEGLIGAVVGFALLPVLSSSITDANLTGATASLANVIPVLYVVVILVGIVAYIYIRNK